MIVSRNSEKTLLRPIATIHSAKKTSDVVCTYNYPTTPVARMMPKYPFSQVAQICYELLWCTEKLRYLQILWSALPHRYVEFDVVMVMQFLHILANQNIEKI